MASRKRALTVGSACTGLATEVMAIQRVLKRNMKHAFMADSCPIIRRYLAEKYPGVSDLDREGQRL
jgi:hypothetical protein